MNYIQVIDEIFRQFEGLKFSVLTWDGKERTYGKGKVSKFTLIFKDANTVKRLLSQGSLGFGESYMSGDIKIKGDIEAYLALRHQFKHIRKSKQLVMAKVFSDFSMSSRREDQISYHYDLGNDFFKLILDSKTMSYSSALYERESDDLGSAQLEKNEFLYKWLDLKKNDTVLDLGSGWGGFAVQAAQKHGVIVTGYTLSRQQLKFSQDLIKKGKLERLVTFKYRNMLNLPKKMFDGVLVLESIEHVGESSLPKFFQDLRSTVKLGGKLVIQTTGRYVPKRVDRWTLKYVFPGGYLPSQEELLSYARNNGFRLEEFRDDTDHYIKTISEWIINLERNKTEIEKMFSPSFFNLWQLWMHGAKVAFEMRSMGLFRFSLRRTL
ncbi:MAG: cyclopropane-fatty-acyl-phospholipid synthase family protein [Candidatus Levybacteria bacterium]|nr:cyclopropane-fatty-acyl-phospholipid synthase family protein [Candidatus Levybacteria bacterium]